MAEVGVTSSGGSGARLPATFGEKLSYMAPVVALTVVVAVLIAFVLVWVVSGKIEDRITDLKSTTEQNYTEHKGLIAELTKEKNQLLADVGSLKETTTALLQEKDVIKQNLTETVQKLDKAQKGLVEVSSNLTKFVETQKDLDSNQNQDISKVSNRLVYVEDKIKKLDALEADVLGLQKDTGNLKGQYVELKGKLQAVKEKGDVTEVELTDLTERTRMFQLRVLAARAKEAADAARQGDLKSLLARLNE